MSKSSMHGLLKTLENCSVVEQREDRLYELGPRIYNLAAYIWNTGLRRLALPVMQHLADSIGETVFLGRVEQRGVRDVCTTLHSDEKCVAAHFSYESGVSEYI